jgi:hypothetical protein
MVRHTPLQNDPQQHQREAKHRTFRVSLTPDPSPDSDSARNLVQKSGLDSHVGPQQCDFASNSGGGTTAGAPTRTRVRPSRNHCTTETLSRTPYRWRCWGESAPIRAETLSGGQDKLYFLGPRWGPEPPGLALQFILVTKSSSQDFARNCRGIKNLRHSPRIKDFLSRGRGV